MAKNNSVCDICNGTGWVCEEHNTTQWEFSDGSTCCEAAGEPCVCNDTGEFEFKYVYACSDTTEVKTWLN